MAKASTLRILARELALAFAPLKRAVSGADEFRSFIARLGWVVGSLPPSYQALAQRVDHVLVAVAALGDDPETGEVIAALDELRQLVAAIRGLSDAPAGVDPAAFLADVREAIVELLLVDYLAARAPLVHRLLSVTGVIQEEIHEEDADRPTFVKSRFHFDEIPRLLSDPSLVPERVYGWGTADLDGRRIASDLLELFAALGLSAQVAEIDDARQGGYQPDPETIDHAMNLMVVVPLFEQVVLGTSIQAGFAIAEVPAEAGKPAGILVEPFVPSEVGTSFPITDDLALAVRAGSDIGTTFGLVIRPGELDVRYPFEPGRPMPSAGFGLTLKHAPASPTVLLGRPSGTRLQIQGAETGLAIDLTDGKLDVLASVVTTGLMLVIAASDPDSFLGDLLGDGPAEVPFPLGLRWSSRTGLGFQGGALAATVSPNKALGPVRVETLSVALRGEEPAGEATRAVLEIGAGLSGSFGPVAFTVAGVGFRMIMAFEDGNLGPVDASIGFKPPNGVGLAIEAGVVSGGGFLSYDEAKAEYAGVLELQVEDIRLSALALLTTRLPDGASGFSLVAVVSGEFTPIQLGLGFTLNGVGGLLGIHRAAAIDALQAAVRGDGIEGILFPEDPVQHATRLLSDLRLFFPPTRNRHIFGPAAKIGWAVIVEAELAILLEVPEPIRLVLLGSVRAALPSGDEALIEINIDIVGVVDFAGKRLAIDAALRDSNVLGFPIEGEAAFRLSWGEPRNFALAIGGFNKRFRPPAGFPDLKRIKIPIGADDNPRIDIQGYLAVTSNTVQLGASAELYAAKLGLNVHGWVGFDTLFTFRPFTFTGDLSAGVDLRRGTTVLAGVHLDATLTGPRPWRAYGEACLEIWLLPDLCVDFDVDWGDDSPIELPPKEVWPLLLAAVEDARNWSDGLPPEAARVVTLAAPPGTAEVLLDPAGTVTLQQRVVPLNRTFTKFNESRPTGPDRFDVTAVTLGGASSPYSTVLDYFAPAQFEELTNDERLSRDSFERMDAGVALTRDAVASGQGKGKPLDYEQVIIDSNGDRRPAGPFRPPLAGQLAAIELGAAATASLRTTGLSRFSPRPGTPAQVVLEDETFVIASVESLAPRRDVSLPATRGETEQALARHLAAHPDERGRLQVVPLHETGEAA